SRFLPDESWAPTVFASVLARSGSLSETARKRSDGWRPAMWARSVPIRPEPTTATPIVLGFVMLGRIAYCQRSRLGRGGIADWTLIDRPRSATLADATLVSGGT